jgi:hypothetical protein
VRRVCVMWSVRENERMGAGAWGRAHGGERMSASAYLVAWPGAVGAVCERLCEDVHVLEPEGRGRKAAWGVGSAAVNLAAVAAPSSPTHL